MKYTVELVAKMTGLSPSSVRVYAIQRKLGKLEGGKKLFTLEEVNKLRSRRKVKSTSKKKPLPKKNKGRKPQNMTPQRIQPSKVEIAEPVVEMKADEKTYPEFGFAVTVIWSPSE